MVIGTYISIITLNVNGLIAPTKRHSFAEWIQKQDLEGNARGKRYGDICIYIADSLCYKAETNTPL